jgi:hypothetical protein
VITAVVSSGRCDGPSRWDRRSPSVPRRCWSGFISLRPRGGEAVKSGATPALLTSRNSVRPSQGGMRKSSRLWPIRLLLRLRCWRGSASSTLGAGTAPGPGGAGCDRRLAPASCAIDCRLLNTRRLSFHRPAGGRHRADCLPAPSTAARLVGLRRRAAGCSLTLRLVVCAAGCARQAPRALSCRSPDGRRRRLAEVWRSSWASWRWCSLPAVCA